MTPFKIRITEPGWESYTGDLGPLSFEGGVSVTEVSHVEAQRLANNIRVEALDGSNPSSSQLVLDTQGVSMSESMEPDSFVDRSVAPAPESIRNYTQAELEAIADEEGITGVRAIADVLGIKGKSIVALIEAVLARQAELAGGVVVAQITEAQPVEQVVITAQPEPVVEAAAEAEPAAE